jgi:hypothetical protein
MNIKGFLDGLSQEKYLVYFLLAWAGTFFFWSISSILSEINYISVGYDQNIASSIVYLLAKLCGLGAGIVLAIVSLKLLIPNFMTGLKRELMVVYFLLLWAGSLFLGAISDILWDITHSFGIGSVGDLCALGAGAVLALIAWKLLQSKSSLEEKLQSAVN